MKQYNNRKSHRGFTLIELLVVVAIVGFLAGITFIMINPREQLQRSRDAQRKHDLRQLQTALQAYYEDNGRHPAADGQQIKDAPWGSSWPPYASRVSKDPLSTQSYFYKVADDKTWYSLYAKLENCKDPQMIPGATCTDYNYAVTSSNIAVALLPTPAPTLTPTPTPTFKRVFLTSTKHKSDLVTDVKTNIDINFTGNGLDAGDVICRTHADAASLGGTWKAWLSTNAVNAVDRIYPPGAGKDNTEYRLVDGIKVIATSKTDLIDGFLGNAIILDEAGNDMRLAGPGAAGWPIATGTSSDGIAVDNANCNGWTTIFSGRVETGEVGWSNNFWTAKYNKLCSNSNFYWLYCFEQ